MCQNTEISMFVDRYLPEIAREMPESKQTTSIYKLMRIAVSYNSGRVRENDLQSAKRCMQAIDTLYTHGSRMTQNAIETVFVYSFTTLLACRNKAEQLKLHAIIPMGLYTLYVHQVEHARFP